MAHNDIDLFENFKNKHPELSGYMKNIDSKSKKVFDESFTTEEEFKEKEHGDFAKIISMAISLAKQYGILPDEIGPKEIDSFIKIASIALDHSFYKELYKDIKEKKFQKVEHIAERIIEFVICKGFAIARHLVDLGVIVAEETINDLLKAFVGIELREQTQYILHLFSIKIDELLFDKIDSLVEKINVLIHEMFESLRSSNAEDEDFDDDYEDEDEDELEDDDE